MTMITLSRITAGAYVDSTRVGYTYADFPTDTPADVVDGLREHLVRCVGRDYPEADEISLSVDEIAWSA